MFLFISRLLALLFFVQSNAFGLDQKLSEIGYSQWFKLLHYESRGWPEKFKSQISDAKFFIDPMGKEDPVLEFSANVQEFRSNLRYPCRFPARAKFIGRILGEKYKPCFEVLEWQSQISADSVSLVYVGQYISNPASAFGHTFLLFESKSRPTNLDMTINNAAKMPSEVGSFDYLYKGLTGGFNSEYYIEPYGAKIQEYNNIENREMWIYDLNLSADQREDLLLHIWELRQISEGYLFLNKNCSFNAYNALAAIHPDLKAISSLERYVSPVETIKKVSKIATRVEFRPSQREKLSQMLGAASEITRDQFSDFINKEREYSNSANSEFLQIVLEYYEYRKTEGGGVLSDSDKINYVRYLEARANLGGESQTLEYDVPSAPDNAFGPQRVGLTYDDRNISIRVALFYHSLLQSQAGFSRFSDLIIMDAELRDTFINKLTLLKASKFVPSEIFDRQYSWSLNVGHGQEQNCSECDYWFFSVEIGKSLKIKKDHLLYSTMGFEMDQSQYANPMIKLGALFDFSDLKFETQYKYVQDVQKLFQNRYEFAIRLNKKIKSRLEIESEIKFRNKENTYQIGINLFAP